MTEGGSLVKTRPSKQCEFCIYLHDKSLNHLGLPEWFSWLRWSVGQLVSWPGWPGWSGGLDGPDGPCGQCGPGGPGGPGGPDGPCPYLIFVTRATSILV